MLTCQIVCCAGIAHIYVLWKHPGHSNRRAFKNTIFICYFVNEDRLHVTVHSFHYITMVLIFGYVLMKCDVHVCSSTQLWVKCDVHVHVCMCSSYM